MELNILFIGDIVGDVGRRIVREKLPGLLAGRSENDENGPGTGQNGPNAGEREQENEQEELERVDFCVANAENVASGSGLTPAIAGKLFSYGVDVITTGDHVWKKKTIVQTLDSDHRLLRPANYPPLASGVGYSMYETKSGHRIGVVNLLGRIFMKPIDCPFRAADEALGRLGRETNIILVDMHAEATSEKIAMGWRLDGQASAVVGTHTHVQTADERILPQGTAYITDLGMTGPYDSVLGRRTDRVLKSMITQMPTFFEVAEGDVRLSGAVVTVDADSGKANKIRRIQIHEDD